MTNTYLQNPPATINLTTKENQECSFYINDFCVRDFYISQMVTLSVALGVALITNRFASKNITKQNTKQFQKENLFKLKEKWEEIIKWILRQHAFLENYKIELLNWIPQPDLSWATTKSHFEDSKERLIIVLHLYFPEFLQAFLNWQTSVEECIKYYMEAVKYSQWLPSSIPSWKIDSKTVNTLRKELYAKHAICIEEIQKYLREREQEILQ